MKTLQHMIVAAAVLVAMVMVFLGVEESDNFKGR